jgi:hypothetical protein
MKLFRKKHAVNRSGAMSPLFIAALAVGCVTNIDESAPDTELSTHGSALLSTQPETFEGAMKGLLELSELAAKIHGGPAAVASTFAFLNEVTGVSQPFEERMAEALETIRADIRDVVEKIAQGQTTVSEQIAAVTIARAATASEIARDFVIATNGAFFDPNNNPDASMAKFESRAATLTFMDDAWYYKVSTTPNAPRAFEWRLGLTHLISAVALRLHVMAALHPDFVSSGVFSGELMSYYDHIGMRLAQAEQALIGCFTQPVVIYPGSDFNLPIRFCYNGQTGTQLGVGTIANPIRDASVRAQLMNEMGFDKIRAFRDGLYALANRLPQNSVECAPEYETCWSSGVKTARYGADGGYYYRTMNGSFLCGNATFGDPRVGPVKSCTVGDLVWNPCAGEQGNCYFDGVKAVRYGANGSFAQKLALAGAECSNVEFGDPLQGVVKACEYADPIWVPCASEGGTCWQSAPSLVRYGFGDKWVYFQAQGSFLCNNGHGDPAVGVSKVCEVAALP